MPFTVETASIAGRKGNRELKRKAAQKTSEGKKIASAANGRLGGRPREASSCTCGHIPHKSTCRVYLAEKKRESRDRLRGLVNKVS